MRVTDFFEEGGNTYLVMDFIEGESLADRIEQQGALPEDQVLEWVDQLLDALGYCHSQGVIHRDVKPQNVIIRPVGQAPSRFGGAGGSTVLVDFGLVKLWDPHDPRTRTAMRGMGTPEYAPPEQYGTQSGHTDPRSDLYSLGATLYHALTGEAPLTAGDRTADPGQFVPLRGWNPRVSPRTEAAVLRAMELTCGKRFQSAAEMRAALRGRRAAPARSRVLVRGWVLGGLAMPALLLLTGVGGLVWRGLQGQGPLAPLLAIPTPMSFPTPTPMTMLPTPTNTSGTATSSPMPTIEPQQISWGPVDGQEAGICVNSCAEFIPWIRLKEEIERKLLPQVANVPVGSTVMLKDSGEKRDWIVQIIGPSGDEVGHVWFGVNPSNDWAFDDLVRVGTPSAPVVVWGTFQRYSDGSYYREQ